MAHDVNTIVYDFLTKRVNATSHLELGELFADFLKLCADMIQESQVWPTNPERICTELVLTCNYLLACLYHQSTKQTVEPFFDSRNAKKILLCSLHRVNLCLSSPVPSGKCMLLPRSSPGRSVSNEILQIISSLENPIIHFMGLTFMGRLFALICTWCLYSKQVDGRGEEVYSSITRMKHLANGSVLKEQLPQYQGLLLNSPLHEDGERDRIAPCVEDLMSLVFIGCEHPCNFSMAHEPWKWLYCFLKCKQFMKENNYILAMSELSKVLKTDFDPDIKARLLCLFADCYHKQGCHQLAIQTYRDALEVDNECSSALWYLSVIYHDLEKNDLELECLNLLVSMLSNTQESGQKRSSHCGVDEIIWSVFSPLIKVTFPLAMYVFAKRCFELKRYKESAEQYFGLISKLQPGSLFQELTNENHFDVDIRELFVEAAEALLMAQRLSDCLDVSSHLCSCLCVNDLFEPQRKILDLLDDENSSSPLFPSQDVSFHTPAESVHPFGTRDIIRQGPSSELLTQKEQRKSPHWGLVLSVGTRKRRRSNDVKQEEEKNGMSEEHLLTARALICKSRALTMIEGHADESMACLSQAIDVLLNHPSNLQMCKLKSPTGTSFRDSKRQRISSDEAHPGVTLECENHERSPCRFTGPNSWTSLMLDAALQMGKASVERRRFSSVINSCNIVFQLDPDNIQAYYMKSVVLMENPNTKRKSATEWLQIRGIADAEDVIKVKTMLHERRALEKSQSSWDEKCLQISDEKMLNFDLQCWQYLLESRQDDTQD